MPGMASRGRGRRTINEINMVPFIDVMLVLLIIFMVTAPMLTPGVIDVPSVGKGKNMPKVVAQVIVNKDGSLQFKTPEATRSVTQREIGDAASRWQKSQGEPNSAVVISADKGVQYENVVKAMDALQKAGVQRVGLSVKQGG
ncbi:MAG: ExbD/TolR family protein [Gammaproteobacteria bacterium]|jgi:biopolymer transport protein TolR|nr:ExbD/TolR family protein [Gammaproteobacteria bacterium]MBU1352510.1 ExbD/TolR family protein [Gammaproteobacteria bacterium]MBU1505308.1 ExbD/TolR family protein [Gammaproteobacteria bacterium]MBU2122713.1 ExbD/TolR family protein [Gammaproteobacteria bacterium]MBU2173049.1 ExbD/TolR family protein [Gammaproteobacteria bacterium]